MSVGNLHKQKMYVLGPLELCPGQFAVGEKSYEAIKGKMPYYNKIRQQFYLDGDKELGDAIGEMETRALTAEDALDRMTSLKKSAETKIKSLAEEIVMLKEEIDQMKKEKKKKTKEQNN